MVSSRPDSHTEPQAGVAAQRGQVLAVLQSHDVFGQTTVAQSRIGPIVREGPCQPAAARSRIDAVLLDGCSLCGGRALVEAASHVAVWFACDELFDANRAVSMRSRPIRGRRWRRPATGPGRR